MMQACGLSAQEADAGRSLVNLSQPGLQCVLQDSQAQETVYVLGGTALASMHEVPSSIHSSPKFCKQKKQNSYPNREMLLLNSPPTSSVPGARGRMRGTGGRKSRVLPLQSIPS